VQEDSDDDLRYSWIEYPAKSKAKADTVRLLIDYGADVTVQDEDHSTPLHLASCLRSAEAVQLLIKHGADVTAKDRKHRTPLHLASSWVCSKTVFLAIQQWADAV